MLLPVSFTKTVGDTTYQLEARPVELTLLAGGVALVLFVLLLAEARRVSGAVVTPIVAALGVPFVGLTTFVYTSWSVPWTRGESSSAASVFRTVLQLDAVAAGLGLGCAVAAVLVLALRTEGQLRLLRLAVPCALIGTTTLFAVHHANALSDVGWLPFFEVAGNREVHVGRDTNAPVQLMRAPRQRFWRGMEDGPQPFEDAAGWNADKTIHVHAARSEGDVPFTAEARRGPVHLETHVSLHAVPERASPLLSLRVGDRFVYRVRATSGDGRLLYFISLSGSESIEEVVIEVVGTREREAFRTFLLEVRREDSVTQVEVVAIAGETRYYDAEHAAVGAPVIAKKSDFDGGDPLPCAFLLLGAESAICQRGGRDADVPAPDLPPAREPVSWHSRPRLVGAPRVGRPPVAFEAAAPAAFTHSTSDGVGSFASIFVTVISIGLVVLPDGTTSSSYTLIATHRGPVGAPEAPAL